MKYFLDTEFIAGFHKPWFGKKRHFVDLVSIGIKAEDGRAYSALSSEYDYGKANNWITSNIIRPIYHSTVPVTNRDDDWGTTNFIPMSQFHKSYGKSNDQIANEIFAFMNPHLAMEGYLTTLPLGFIEKHNLVVDFPHPLDKYHYHMYAQPEIYGYFSGFDYTLLSSLFGTFDNHPSGFPMYIRDLKQTLDEKAAMYARRLNISHAEALEKIKNKPTYPVNRNEHNALSDAMWIEDLYKFIQASF